MWHHIVNSQVTWNPLSLFGSVVPPVAFTAVFQTPDLKRVTVIESNVKEIQPRHVRINRWEIDRLACGFTKSAVSPSQLDIMVRHLGKITDLGDRAYEPEWIPCSEYCHHRTDQKLPWYKEEILQKPKN